MKKWLLVLGIVAALFLSIVYIVIPNKLVISAVTLVKANSHGAYRILVNEHEWPHLFGNKVAMDAFQYNNTMLKINKKLPEGVEVLIKSKDSSIASVIEVVQLNEYSSVIKWTMAVENSANPFNKIKQYLDARSIKENMTGVLDNMKRFLEKEDNVYGIKVHQTTVKDTVLIATRSFSKTYPSVQDIYHLIQLLRDYAQTNNAKESGYPMLNIKKTDSANFETMVALPINKELDDHGPILDKEMVAGNILFTEIKGGPYTISKAFNSLGNYVADHDMVSPAIPFQSLITDRSKEPDTTKWITKIYYPIY